MKNWSLKTLFIGKARDLSDRSLFHKISLIAVLAWVGLGADGLSSSCYGPEETFKALGTHTALSVFVAFACVATIVVICMSYRQIIELFPSGGGGYLVASKLLSPAAGVVSGSALLVDYVLTITISIASGADQLFSVLPPAWQPWKLAIASGGVVFLTVLNLRGVRESVLLWLPVFFLFVGTHAVAILVAVVGHAGDFPAIVSQTATQVRSAHTELGLFGMLALMLRAYSMGAGTYTGIEAVSNGLPILREPRVQTGKRTMNYMGASLAITVFGLLLAYLLYAVKPIEGKTLNAVLFENITASWPSATGHWFVTISMLSATVLLFIAAQAGFIDGPRVLANMALDRWFPGRFATLSDRFVTQNGVLLMGGAGLFVMLATRGAMDLLVVLYSINVFITFSLSQFGMVRHWWKNRATAPRWKSKLLVNGIGLCFTSFILASLCVVKFHEGGWITLVVTGAVVGLAFLVKRHYLGAMKDLKRLDTLVETAELPTFAESNPTGIQRVTKGRTAIVFVNGFNGLGLHTFLGIPRLFPETFGNFIFVQVGALDAGSFKGAEELDRLKSETADGVQRYVEFAQRHGFAAEGVTEVGHDIIDKITELSDALLKKYPNAVLFGGQLAFTKETIWTRWLHNYAVFALQRLFCRRGMPFIIVPAKV
ncbi:MAG: APC family permease [Verrucomicrobia bacterium]|nr:APC family permease [Verrucomicrobiota bacterium]